MSHIHNDMLNTNNKWIDFGLTNINTFIIRVEFEFGLANVDTIRTMTQHEHDPCIRSATPSSIYYHSEGYFRNFFRSLTF